MTVNQLIEKLKQFPTDMPVTIYHDIDWRNKYADDTIAAEICTWIHSNYPYDKPDFDYVNLE